MVTREKAEEIARTYVQEQGRHYEVECARTFKEVEESHTQTPRLYHPGCIDWGTSWIVYLGDHLPGSMIKSSTIIIVSQENGEVHYFGDVSDEG